MLTNTDFKALGFSISTDNSAVGMLTDTDWTSAAIKTVGMLTNTDLK